MFDWDAILIFFPWRHVSQFFFLNMIFMYIIEKRWYVLTYKYIQRFNFSYNSSEKNMNM